MGDTKSALDVEIEALFSDEFRLNVILAPLKKRMKLEAERVILKSAGFNLTGWGSISVNTNSDLYLALEARGKGLAADLIDEKFMQSVEDKLKRELKGIKREVRSTLKDQIEYTLSEKIKELIIEKAVPEIEQRITKGLANLGEG